MISLQLINKYVCEIKVQSSEHLITFNLYKFVRLMVISILIERNISDEPFAATGSLYFCQQMATVLRITTT